jgi:hypothetical protein
MKRLLMPLLLIVALVPPAFAQDADKCEGEETIQMCLDRVSGAIKDAAATADETKAKADVAKANTGVPSVSGPLGSAVKDFVSRFLASADSSFLTQNNDGSITLDLNVGAKKFVTGNPFKVQAILHAPKLDAKVKAGLTGDTLLNTEKSLDELDDIEFSLSYSPQNRNLGRDLEPHRPLFQALVASAPFASEDIARFRDKVGELTRTFGAEIMAREFKDMGTARASIEPATIAAGRQLAGDNAAAVQQLKDNDIDTFVALLDQQPQLFASVIQRNRNELIGGDSLSFKVTYETSGRSLRNFYQVAATNGCGETQLAARDGDCADAWRAFAADEKTQLAAETSGRFAFSLEYTGVDANNVEVALPAPATGPFKLATDETESLIGSITYGYTMAKDDAGMRKNGFDLKVSYENVTGDKDKDNRFVASATYSHKMSDTMTMPIGIVYANHENDPAFKDTDRKLAMHFGLVFKMPDLKSILPSR